MTWASLSDTDFFAANPSRIYRMRMATPSEIGGIDPAPDPRHFIYVVKCQHLPLVTAVLNHGCRHGRWPFDKCRRLMLTASAYPPGKVENCSSNAPIGGVNLKNLRDIFLPQLGSLDIELVLQLSPFRFIGVSGFRKPRNLV
jgi:hypothetical protein